MVITLKDKILEILSKDASALSVSEIEESLVY